MHHLKWYSRKIMNCVIWCTVSLVPQIIVPGDPSNDPLLVIIAVYLNRIDELFLFLENTTICSNFLMRKVD